MPRLPVPGGDANTWGDILNTYLEASHAADGSLLSSAVDSAIAAGSIDEAQLADDAVSLRTIASSNAAGNNQVLSWNGTALEWVDPGTPDHGSLSGLGDDDHPQYALADGSRGSFATTAQGALADTAVQPGDDITALSSGVIAAGYAAVADGSGGITWVETGDAPPTPSVSVIGINDFNAYLPNNIAAPSAVEAGDLILIYSFSYDQGRQITTVSASGLTFQQVNAPTTSDWMRVFWAISPDDIQRNVSLTWSNGGSGNSGAYVVVRGVDSADPFGSSASATLAAGGNLDTGGLTSDVVNSTALTLAASNTVSSIPILTSGDSSIEGSGTTGWNGWAMYTSEFGYSLNRDAVTFTVPSVGSQISLSLRPLPAPEPVYVEQGDDANTLGSGAATDGYVLTADGAGGVAWEAGGGVEEAPEDGKTYGRKDAAWTEALPITGGTLEGTLRAPIIQASPPIAEYIGGFTTPYSYNTSWSLDIPPETQPGDVLVLLFAAHAAWSSDARDPSNLDGFAQIPGFTYPNGSHIGTFGSTQTGGKWFYKIADGADPGRTVTINTVANAQAKVSLLVIRNAADPTQTSWQIVDGGTAASVAAGANTWSAAGMTIAAGSTESSGMACDFGTVAINSDGSVGDIGVILSYAVEDAGQSPAVAWTLPGPDDATGLLHIPHATTSSLLIDSTTAYGGNRITNVADPTDSQDVATKAYVDALPTIPDPSGESDGRLLGVTSGALAYTDAPAAVTIPPFAHFGDISVGAGTSRWYNDSGATVTITSLRANLGTASTGADVLIDVNVDGATALGGSPLTITDGTITSGPVATSFTVSSGSYITVDVDQIGSTVPGNNLTVFLGVG